MGKAEMTHEAFMYLANIPRVSTWYPYIELQSRSPEKKKEKKKKKKKTNKKEKEKKEKNNVLSLKLQSSEEYSWVNRQFMCNIRSALNGKWH